jgi:hypothetical protein
VIPDAEQIKERVLKLVRTGKLTSFAEEAPCNVDGTFALDETNHLRHAILGRDADQHVHMVHHKVAFYYLTLPLHGELSEHLAQMFPELLIESLPSVLGNPYYMVLAVPYCVAYTLILIHTKAFLSVNFERFIKGRLSYVAVNVKDCSIFNPPTELLKLKLCVGSNRDSGCANRQN